MAEFDTTGMIDVTDHDLVKMVQAAYDLSVPMGMGFVHYEEGPLSDHTAETIIQNTDSTLAAVSMDYVKGRCVKFTVRKHSGDDRLYIPGQWFDHTDEQLRELLERSRKS